MYELVRYGYEIRRRCSTRQDYYSKVDNILYSRGLPRSSGLSRAGIL